MYYHNDICIDICIDTDDDNDTCKGDHTALVGTSGLGKEECSSSAFAAGDYKDGPGQQIDKESFTPDTSTTSTPSAFYGDGMGGKGKHLGKKGYKNGKGKHLGKEGSAPSSTTASYLVSETTPAAIVDVEGKGKHLDKEGSSPRTSTTSSTSSSPFAEDGKGKHLGKEKSDTITAPKCKKAHALRFIANLAKWKACFPVLPGFNHCLFLFGFRDYYYSNCGGRQVYYCLLFGFGIMRRRVRLLCDLGF